MEEDIRGKIFNQFTKITLFCQKHPEDVINMLIINEQSERRGLICATCLSILVSDEPKAAEEVKPLKLILLEIHQSCHALLSNVSIAAFVDHHINLIRGIGLNHFKEMQVILQASITNYFQKTRELLNGKYFQQFYLAVSNILQASNKTNKLQIRNHHDQLVRKLFDFIMSFSKAVNQYDQYQNMTLQERLSGESLMKQIRIQVGQIYKEFKEKSQSLKNNWQEEEILQIFNPTNELCKNFKFSSTLIHPLLSLTDSKKVKMPDLPDNQYTMLALIEPSIGNKKRSIKLKMDGVRGWVAAGITKRSFAESGGYKFEQSNHGTVQISYDGYSWSEESSVNEQYTSWYYNQNDTLTITINPSTKELVFMRNEDANVYTLKYNFEKKEKIYFCVSVNYFQDAVSIVD